MNFAWRGRREARPVAVYSAQLRDLLKRLKIDHVPIAYRLAGSFALLVVLGMGLLSTLVLTYQAELMRQQINAFGTTIASQFAHSATEPLFIDDFMALRVMTSNLISDPQILGAAVFDEQGTQLFATGDVPEDNLQAVIAAGRVTAGDLASLEWHQQRADAERDLVSFIAPISFQDVVAGHALVSLSVAAIQDSFRNTAQVLLLVTVVMMLLGIAMAAWMSRRMAKPVKDLVDATDTLASGNYDIQLTTRRRDELGRLSAAFNRMARSLREKNQIKGVLSRFVADDVAQAMLSDLDNVDVGCSRVDASVLFVDIVGFTELAESCSAEEVVELLNEYFAYFTACSKLYFGTVDKFIGDCAMIVFGAPRKNPDHRFNAIACATVMLQLLEQVNALRRERGLREVHVRIGINSGEMMAGILGGSQRMEYTVVGDTVNVASRLSRLASPGDMVVGEAVSKDSSLNNRVSFTAGGEAAIRGRKGIIRIYRVAAIAPEYQRTMDTMIADILEHKASAPLSSLPLSSFARSSSHAVARAATAVAASGKAARKPVET